MGHKKENLKELIVSPTEYFSTNVLYFCKLYPSIQLVKSEIGSNAPALFSFIHTNSTPKYLLILFTTLFPIHLSSLT